jgi:enoyl-CoA hydratase
VIASEDRGAVRVIALDRPPVNAVNLALVEALAGAIRTARADAGCRALVLTGRGGAFSAGIDRREVPAYGPEARATMLRTINRTIYELYGLPKPVVAAVSGHALGAALVLVLACDARLAAKGEFRLGLTEAAAGIPFPAGPLRVVQAELSPENARVLALGSLATGPEWLAARGVLDRLVAPAALLDEALGEAGRLAALPAFGPVKEQLRARTCEALRRIVETDDEPLQRGWI